MMTIQNLFKEKKEAMIIYFIYIYITSIHVNGEYLIGLFIMIDQYSGNQKLVTPMAKI